MATLSLQNPTSHGTWDLFVCPLFKNIVYELCEHGTPHFNDIYKELKWIEAVDSPTTTEEDNGAQ